MAYYSKTTDRMDIHIEEYRGTVLIKQKWKYNWLNAIGTSSWTHSEKQNFHNKVDRLIWNSWGNHFFLKVKGTSDFAIKHKTLRWDNNFDIEWTLHQEHWKVNVTKYPNNYIGNPTSSVSWNAKEIKLDTKDTAPRKRPSNGVNYFQYPVLQEFGHSVGNSIFANLGMHGDEYKTSSSHYADRNRHLDFLLKELNTMIPNTQFSKY